MEHIGTHPIPSWGVWPGAASLPPLSGGNCTIPTTSPPDVTSSYTHTRPRPAVHEGKRTYRKKDRILFTGKPPALPQFTTAINPDEDLWTWLAKHIILLSHLEWWMNDCDVRDAGLTYGDIRGIRILTNPTTGSSTGLGLIEFTNPAAVDSAIQNNGKSWISKQKSNICIHQLTPTIVKSLFHSNVNLSNLEPHWAYGTWLSNEVIDSLHSVAETPRNNLTIVQQSTHTQTSQNFVESPLTPLPTTAEPSPMPLTHEHPSQAQSLPPVSQEHPSLSQSLPPVSQEHPSLSQSVNDPRVESFRFPFAAAAIAATALLERMKEHRSDHRTELKRQKSDQADVHETTDGSPEQRKRRRSESPSEGDVDYSFIEQSRIPYWSESLQSLPRLPSDSMGAFPRRPWRATEVSAQHPQPVTHFRPVRRPQQQQPISQLMWLQNPSSRQNYSMADITRPQSYHLNFGENIVR